MRDERNGIQVHGTAWQSLNKTISEIMEYLEDDSPRQTVDLRAFMYDKMADVSESWLREGFYLAHRACWEELRDNEEIPATLTYDYSDAILAPTINRDVDLSSRIRRV